MPLAIFDLDNTLLHGDSDHGWGEFIISKNLVDAKDYRAKNDAFYQDYLMMHFKRAGLKNVFIFSSGEELFQHISFEQKPFMCILDYRIEGGMNGNQILLKIKKAFPTLPVIILSAQETLNVAVQSLKIGAYDYVVKDEYAFERIENLLVKIVLIKVQDGKINLAIHEGKTKTMTSVVPNFEPLEAYAREQGISYRTREELVENPAILAMYQERISSRSAELAPYEQVKAFALLPAPFAQETGELTPTQKIKRKVVAEKYASQVEAMYPED